MSAPKPHFATPLTVVEMGKTSYEEMAASITKTISENGDILQPYHNLWYECGHTWHYTQFLGVGLMKSPNDMWTYQDLMVRYKPKTIIETGTYQGASALWLAILGQMLGIDTKVFTVDINKEYRRCSHPNITFIEGDSTDPATLDLIMLLAENSDRTFPRPLMVILDADHSAEHVRKELELYAPLIRAGEWIIVEDTNISWPGEYGDRGAAGALRDYLAEHPWEFRQDVLCERYLLTMNPGGWMQRMRTPEQAAVARRTGWAYYAR